MLNFQSITLEDKQAVQKHIQPKGVQICEYCFTDLFIWKDHYDTEIAFEDGFLFIRMRTFPEKLRLYLFPIGEGDLAAALDKLRACAEQEGSDFILCSIPEDKKEIAAQLLPEHDIRLLDGCWDYVYEAEKFRTYSGKKLQSKRNFVNRFCREWENRWTYEEINESNISDAYQLHLKWCEQDGSVCKNGVMYSGETCAIWLCLNNMDALGLRGGLIRIDGEPVAFSLGSPVNEDTFIVQIEKADDAVAGAYPMIAQQFAIHNTEGYRYINREEDLGIPGLRKSKKSYKPLMMAAKYTAVPQTPNAMSDEPSINLEEI